MEKKNDDDVLLESLEHQRNWDNMPMVKYQGFWTYEFQLQGIISSQKNFKAENSDIILSSMPKGGTTWLKALLFSIVNRKNHPINESPLLTTNPHPLVPYLEIKIPENEENPDLQPISSPRLFSTHMSFSVLPASIRESECKIIYICRNLLDQFVSYQQFSLNNNFGDGAEGSSTEKAFDMYCQGIQPSGPLWDQMLEYWDAHLKNPEKVLFLKYEDLKEDVSFHVRQIAEFIGLPFSPEEENQGLVEQITTLCSLESLKNQEVNKNSDKKPSRLPVKLTSFFRKGQVGDWKNHLTPAMAERLQKLVESKLQGIPDYKKLIG